MSFRPPDRSQREAGCASCGRQRLSFRSNRVSMLRQLSSEDIEALAVGAWILGSGGGGSPYHGLLSLRRLYQEGARVSLIDPDELDDQDDVAVVSMMGAPLVILERLVDARLI